MDGASADWEGDRPMKQIFFVWNYLFNIFLSFLFVALFFAKYKIILDSFPFFTQHHGQGSDERVAADGVPTGPDQRRGV